jgi:hypothetical protein
MPAVRAPRARLIHHNCTSAQRAIVAALEDLSVRSRPWPSIARADAPELP